MIGITISLSYISFTSNPKHGMKHENIDLTLTWYQIEKYKPTPNMASNEKHKLT